MNGNLFKNKQKIIFYLFSTKEIQKLDANNRQALITKISDFVDK